VANRFFAPTGPPTFRGFRHRQDRGALHDIYAGCQYGCLFAWLLCQEADRTVAVPNGCHRRKYGLRQALPDGQDYPLG
jgi:hypothetical protein